MNKNAIIKYTLLSIVIIILGLGFLSIVQEFLQSKDLQDFFQKFFKFTIYKDKDNQITIRSILIGLSCIVIGFWIAKLISSHIIYKLLTKLNMIEGNKASIQNLSFYTMFLIVIMISFGISKIPLTIFTLFGGALAIGIGFGSQNLVNNFMSGLIVQMERPIKVGDLIVLDSFRGKVEEIGARSTKIITAENTHIIIPNSLFIEKPFINWTLNNNIIRCNVKVSFDYKHSPESIIKMIQECIVSISGVQKSPEPSVVLTDFGESGLEFNAYFWINIVQEKSRFDYENDLRIKIYNKAKELNLEIPYPHRVILSKKD